jgi:hypothetical protein
MCDPRVRDTSYGTHKRIPRAPSGAPARAALKCLCGRCGGSKPACTASVANRSANFGFWGHPGRSRPLGSLDPRRSVDVFIIGRYWPIHQPGRADRHSRPRISPCQPSPPPFWTRRFQSSGKGGHGFHSLASELKADRPDPLGMAPQLTAPQNSAMRGRKLGPRRPQRV